MLLPIFRTLTSPDPHPDMRLSIAAILLVAVGGGILAMASNPYRAPFTRRSFSLVVFCGILAMMAEGAATAGRDLMIRDDWGTVVIGLLLLAASPFRPSREILVATLASVVCVGVVVAAESPTFATKAPAFLYVVIGITPVLALGVGSAVYSSTFVHLVDQWLTRARFLTDESAHEMRPGIARSVQQDRVTGLNREVVPLFSELVERGAVTEEDSRRARHAADAIRQRIVSESDRSWLEQLLLDVCPDGNAGTITDRGHLADGMTTDQRTAIRALVGATSRDPSARQSTLGIALHDDEPLVRALIRIERPGSDTAVRQLYAPYFAVLRILFRDLQVDVNGSLLTLRFSYDQH
ncbi:hypothetical protein GCM10025780_22230 [Frondihabitans cladoniiphilus]|uniref:Uncharacterized protein n=1 Tax=Frondihabitans cladoniiphilus TaxID=715785 RepID=A0ABP8W1K1_9MICO